MSKELTIFIQEDGEERSSKQRYASEVSQDEELVEVERKCSTFDTIVGVFITVLLGSIGIGGAYFFYKILTSGWN
jgi:hypothetical protein